MDNRRAWLALGVSLLLIVLWEVSGLDLSLTRVFGASQGFALRHAWWAERVLHDGSRWVAAALLLGWAFGAWRPVWAGPPRSARLYWLAVLLLDWLMVPALKRSSLTSCPWELAEFGGSVRYVPHWMLGLSDGGPGHCFPSGHATTAFAFFALAMLWQPYHPRAARSIAVATACCGALLALAQLARGAHHLSHSLWSAWLCGAVVMVASWLAPAKLATQRP